MDSYVEQASFMLNTSSFSSHKVIPLKHDGFRAVFRQQCGDSGTPNTTANYNNFSILHLSFPLPIFI